MRVDELIVEVRDSTLNRVGQITAQDLVDAVFVTRFNNIGSWSIRLPSGHPLGELLRLPGYGIVVTGPGDRTIISGPTLSAKLEQTTDNLKGDWLIEGSDDSIYLAERLAYPDPSTDDVANQTTSYDFRDGPSESVIKGFVSDNIGPTAPISRQVESLTIEADSLRGNDVSSSARFDNLQELVYSLAQVGGLGYRFEQPGDTIEFVVYEPQDLSNTIRMDLQNQKLSKAEYSYGSAKVTRAIVGGGGDGVSRVFVERTNADSLSAESAWNRRIEVFTDARQTTATEELNTAGDEELVDNGKTIVQMSVTPSDDINMVYGIDWFLGDTITVVANEIEASAVVTEIGISVQADGVRIGATVGTPVGLEFESKIIAKQQDQETRISHLETKAEGGGSPVAENGLPQGGSAGQILIKDTSANYDASWQNNYAGEVRAIVYNGSGDTLLKGTPVMVIGTAGDHIQVGPAVADGSVEPRYIFGVITDDLGNGQQGTVILLGVLDDIDTSAYNVGDVLWLDPAVPGGWTTTEPIAPNLAMSIGFVTRSQSINGRLYIRMYNQQVGLHELHDVAISSVSDGEVLVYNGTSGIWQNGSYSYSSLTGVPSTFPPSAHTHPISEVVDLQTALNAKAALAGATFTGSVLAPNLELTGTQTLDDARARNVTVSASEPTGGNIGDIWIQV